LGLAALTTLSANAADSVDSQLKFSGWVDTIFGITDDDADDTIGTEKDEESATLGFDAIANLKATWQATNELHAKVNLWLWPDNSELQMREAFFEYSVNSDITVRMGKFINPIGWISTEPVGLWRVHNSLIGYADIYGNDVIGAAISWAPKDQMVSGSLALTNGYFVSGDAMNRNTLWGHAGTGTDANRENDALAVGLDVLFNVTPELVIDVDFVYEQGSDGSQGNTVPGAAVGGDIMLIGANGEYKLNDQLSLAAEIMHIAADDADLGGSVADTAGSRTQELVGAKYALSGTSFPMAVSAQVQAIQATAESGAGDTDTDSMEVALALLTNPLSVSNFGLNYEFAWTSEEVDAPGAGSDTDSDAWGLFVEGLVTY
jgi:hypothetical protein